EETLRRIVSRADPERLSPIQYEAAIAAAKIAQEGLDGRAIVDVPVSAREAEECDVGPVDFPSDCFPNAHPAPQPSGAVKALEWVASDDWEDRWIADLYAIEDQGKNWSTDRYWLYYNGQRLGKFGTFDAASSAAQADYE